jgi:hypothetical protein
MIMRMEQSAFSCLLTGTRIRVLPSDSLEQ